MATKEGPKNECETVDAVRRPMSAERAKEMAAFCDSTFGPLDCLQVKYLEAVATGEIIIPRPKRWSSARLQREIEALVAKL